MMFVVVKSFVRISGLTVSSTFVFPGILCYRDSRNNNSTSSQYNTQFHVFSNNSNNVGSMCNRSCQCI